MSGLEFDVGSMTEVRYWRIRFNYACRSWNPQNHANSPVPCKHCVDVHEHEDTTNIIQTWVCPRVIEAVNEIGSAIVCLDCVLEGAEKAIAERKE